MGTMIDVYVRHAAEDPEQGEYLGRIPLTECEAFANYFMSTRPWFKGDGWGTGGGHFFYEGNGWRFEVVVDGVA